MTMTTDVRIEGLSAALGGREVLHQIDTRFEPGHLTAIIGPNGAGKTTLLRSIIGSVPSTGGRVVVGGRPVDHYRPRELARKVAFVPQDTHAEFSFRVEEVILMGRYPHLGLLERAGTADRQAVLDAMCVLGIEPLKDRNIMTLSEGECQRVLVARALATQSRVLLLDEPVSHLDIAHRLTLVDLLLKLAKDNLTVAVVLHDLDLALRYADRVVVINDGRAVASGTPEELLEDATIETVFGVSIERLDGSTGRYLGISQQS